MCIYIFIVVKFFGGANRCNNSNNNYVRSHSYYYVDKPIF